MTNYRRIFEENSYIFITVVTFKRNPLLIKNVALLRESFKQSKEHIKYDIFGIVIMPDHFHMIIKPEDIKDYPKILFSIKYYFSKNIKEADILTVKGYLTESNIIKKEKGVWQRRYWAHIITNEIDLYNHLDYIHWNPVKASLVKNVADWQYSSFKKFVNLGYYDINWGSTEDIRHIHSLDLEFGE